MATEVLVTVNIFFSFRCLNSESFYENTDMPNVCFLWSLQLVPFQFIHYHIINNEQIEKDFSYTFPSFIFLYIYPFTFTLLPDGFLYDCNLRFITRNLEEFIGSINQNKPMFQVDAILSAPEIVMKPTETEVYNIVIHSVKDFLER